MGEERLQKVLARAGFGSRRSCEALIEAGRITVNGRRAKLGQKVLIGQDDIRVDGEKMKGFNRNVYVLFNKPKGVLSSTKSQGGLPTVVDFIDIPERIFPVGRLDLDSRGLVLLTNDGELTHRLTHPKFGHEKEYKVLLDRAPDQEQLDAWKRGVILPDGSRTLPADVRIRKRTSRGCWMHVTLKQGMKRQIRETAEVLGLKVLDLIRVRTGNLELGNLEQGSWRYLTDDEVKQLKMLVRRPVKPTRLGNRSKRRKS
ncbi:MAG: pseudouridine synthase [Anaerolineales bacterium]|nr:pseudouridine synthase [Anaerolineales bacterium]